VLERFEVGNGAYVRALAVEPEANALWVGTSVGVHEIDLATRDVRETFTREHGLANEYVFAIGIDRQGYKWFGTNAGGVSMLDGETWRSWTHADGLGAPNAQGLEASRNTGLGTRSRHDLGVMRSGAPTYNPSYVFAIHVAADDTVCAGTWGGGLGRFDGTQWRYYTAADGLPANHVFMLAEDPAGHLWAGTSHGLARLDGQRFSAFTTADGLLAENVFSMDVAPDGSFWVGRSVGSPACRG
jgi:ligand-binding sensor domain-containing protein